MKKLNETCKEILRIIKECNSRNEAIYLKKLIMFSNGRVAKTTLQKWVRYLVENGELVEQTLTEGNRTIKHLYLPGSVKKRSEFEMLCEIDRKMNIVVRFLLKHEMS